MADFGGTKSCCMIGGGSYGTALARVMGEAVLAKAANRTGDGAFGFVDEVKLWVRRQ